MGKITDALRKIRSEREQAAAQRNQIPPADQSLKIDTPAQHSVTQEEVRKRYEIPEKQEDARKTLSPTLKERFDRLNTDSFEITEPLDATGIDPKVITYYDYNSAISEQYRILRTNIKSCLARKNQSKKIDSIKSLRETNIITVTSSLHAEGKTLTCINMAAVLAKDLESKVLLIDCDLRSGSIHKFLNKQKGPGMSDILQFDYDFHNAIQPTAIQNLSIISSGKAPANPSELLGSKKMRLLIERLRAEDFSYIIIDTPPLIPFTDAGVVGAHTDGIILVVQAHRVQAKVVQKTKEYLDHAHANLLGFILTQTEYYLPDMYSYYYYRYRKNEKKEELVAA